MRRFAVSGDCFVPRNDAFPFVASLRAACGTPHVKRYLTATKQSVFFCRIDCYCLSFLFPIINHSSLRIKLSVTGPNNPEALSSFSASGALNFITFVLVRLCPGSSLLSPISRLGHKLVTSASSVLLPGFTNAVISAVKGGAHTAGRLCPLILTVASSNTLPRSRITLDRFR